MHESEKWKWSRSVMSDSQRPHGLQPTRLLHPWDFPGKSTGVGCHCLTNIVHRHIYYIWYEYVNFLQNSLFSRTVVSVWLFATPWSVAHQAPLSMDFSGKNTGGGCLFLLQGIFPTQGSNPHLLHWQEDWQGSRWIPYPWATREAHRIDMYNSCKIKAKIKCWS